MSSFDPKNVINKIFNIALYALKGSKKCPICKFKIKSFLPLPDIYKLSVTIKNDSYSYTDFETLNYLEYICPVCGATDRDRLIGIYFDQLSEVNKTELLHIAPSKALNVFLKKKQMNVRTADIGMDDVDDMINIEKMDLYKNDRFDYFICSHVLEHVVDDRRAISELYRILRGGGHGILLVPLPMNLKNTYEDPSITSADSRLRHYGQIDHLRIYSKSDFIEHLRSAGFHVEQLGMNFFSENCFTISGLSKTSTLYVVSK